MAEPALRELDRNLPRVEMRSHALIARQRVRQRRAGAANLEAERAALLDLAQREALAMVESARREALDIVAAARRDAARIAAEAGAGRVAPAAPPPRPVLAIVAEIAARHGLRPGEILGDSRRRHVVAARFEAVGQAHAAHPELSASALGRLFNRDHTSILHVLRRLAARGGDGEA